MSSDEIINASGTAGPEQIVFASGTSLATPTASELVVFVTESATAGPPSSPSKKIGPIVLPAVLGGVALALLCFLLLLYYLRRRRNSNPPPPPLPTYHYERKIDLLKQEGQKGRRPSGSMLSESSTWDSFDMMRRGSEGQTSQLEVYTSYVPPPVSRPVSLATHPVINPAFNPVPYSIDYSVIPPDLLASSTSTHQPLAASIPTLHQPRPTHLLPNTPAHLSLSTHPHQSLQPNFDRPFPSPPSPCHLADPFAPAHSNIVHVVGTAEDATAASTGKRPTKRRGSSSVGHGGGRSERGSDAGHGGGMDRLSRQGTIRSVISGSSEGHGTAEGAWWMDEREMTERPVPAVRVEFNAPGWAK